MKINGPINITRLEGKINNINKVLYIFSDIHFEPYAQSSCHIDEAVDIDKYLSDIFLKVEKTIDFFIEIDYVNIDYYKKTSMKQIYISNLKSFFARNFDIDVNKIVKQSSKYKNVRFHYGDIRDGDTFHDYTYALVYNRLDPYNSIPQDTWAHDHKLILYPDKYMIDNFINNIEQLNKVSNTLKLEFYKNYYINKIKNKINNEQVKNKLHKYLDLFYNNIKNTKLITQKFVNNVNKINDYYIKIEEFNLDQLIKKVYNPLLKLKENYIYNYWDPQSVLLMDLYFLRRFLDKDYIKNAILYCGSLHSIDIIYILVNEFNFKITHTTSNLDNLNKKIKNNNYKDILYNGLQALINNKTIIQCSDISLFPKNFM